MDVDKYEKIVAFAHSQIENVDKFYRRLFWGITIIVSVFLFAFTFLFFNSFDDLKDKLTDDINSYKIKVNNQIDSLKGFVQNKVESDLLEVRTNLNNRIQSEFNQEKITGLVENKAKQRVDLKADALIEKQISYKIQPQINENIKKYDQLNKTLELSKNEFDFRVTEAKANNDDRAAYDKLVKWSNDNDFPFMLEAKKIVEQIKNEYSRKYLQMPHVYLMVRSEKKVPNYNARQYSEMLSYESKENRKNLIDKLMEEDSLSIREKYDILSQVLKTDKSLAIVSKTGHLFIENNNLNYYSLDVDKIIEWWNVKRNNL